MNEQISGYWRNSSSSEEEIAEHDIKRKARKNPRRHLSNRDIVKEVKTDMRTQAEIRRAESRMTRNRNLSECSSDSDDGI
jgi:hypothetical protein